MDKDIVTITTMGSAHALPHETEPHTATTLQQNHQPPLTNTELNRSQEPNFGATTRPYNNYRALTNQSLLQLQRLHGNQQVQQMFHRMRQEQPDPQAHHISSTPAGIFAAKSITQPRATSTLQRKPIDHQIKPFVQPYEHREWIFRHEIYNNIIDYFVHFVKSEYDAKKANSDVTLSYSDYELAMRELKIEVDGGGVGNDERNNIIQAKVKNVQQTLKSLIFHLNIMEGGNELYEGLRTEANLPQEYDEFCDVVFSHVNIMESITDRLDDEVYKLYSAGTDPNAMQPGIGQRDDEATFNNYYIYWKAIFQAAGGRESELQSKNVSLADVLRYWKAWFNLKYSANRDDFCKQMEGLWKQWANAFVYVSVNTGDATYRVYANVTADSVGDVAARLIGCPGVIDFKFAGPAIIGSRSEGLVVYCDGRESAQKLAALLAAHVQIVPGRPAMTEKVGGSTGIGIGAEPALVATGMRTRLKELGTGSFEAHVQSFGLIRSEVIASAILHYRSNQSKIKDLGITKQQLFKRFVAIGLKGWGSALTPKK